MDSKGQYAKQSWQVHPTFHMPSPFPPAIMFSLWESDPRPRFEQAVRNAPSRGAAWNDLFRDVPGDRIQILYRDGGRQAVADGREGEVVFSLMIVSNEPEGKKWLVSRSVEFRGKSYCWCVPVEVRKGTRTEIDLTWENVTVL